jgi:hypothetical protein
VHYLKLGGQWMEAYDLIGSWFAAGLVPDGAESALATIRREGRIDPAVAQYRGPMPAVYVTTTPATLVVTDGEPQYVPVNGTPLLSIGNTASTVFREPTDQELYVRIPAGWFRAWTTSGPWERVPAEALPADLKN